MSMVSVAMDSRNPANNVMTVMPIITIAVRILVDFLALVVEMVYSMQVSNVMMVIIIIMTPVQISVSQVRQMQARWV